jgi:hypothetical protein
MTERPRAEAISYIPVTASKEAVRADELKMLASMLLFIVLIASRSKVLEN